MNPWLAFAIGLVVGSCFAFYGVSWILTALIRSQEPDLAPEVEARLDAELERIMAERQSAEERSTWS